MTHKYPWVLNITLARFLQIGPIFFLLLTFIIIIYLFNSPLVGVLDLNIFQHAIFYIKLIFSNNTKNVNILVTFFLILRKIINSDKFV